MSRTPDRLEMVPTASAADSALTLSEVLLPLISRGLIVRRRPIVAAAERLDLDRRAIRRLQKLRQRYGSGPLLLRIPGRRVAVILEPQHVHRVRRVAGPVQRRLDGEGACAGTRSSSAGTAPCGVSRSATPPPTTTS